MKLENGTAVLFSLFIYFFQWTMVSVSLKRLLGLWAVKSVDLDKCDIFIWIYVALWD